jgi:hypothetical protein
MAQKTLQELEDEYKMLQEKLKANRHKQAKLAAKKQAEMNVANLAKLEEFIEVYCPGTPKEKYCDVLQGFIESKHKKDEQMNHESGY